jgi:sugar phosphate isomerase/epimerase
MKLGVFSDTIGGGSPEEVAERTRALGVETVQLRLDWPGLSVLDSAADRAQLRRAYESVGLEIAALAGYTNLLDPRSDRRQANRQRFEQVIRIAPELGTRLVVTETGTYDPLGKGNDDPHNHTPEAWAEFVEVTAQMTHLCEREGVTLAYEPYFATVLGSARDAQRLTQELASSALAFVLDSAGLMTPATLSHNRAITAEAVELLRGHIALAHADDVRYDGDKARWLPLGWGDLDADAFLDGLVRTGYDGAVIIEFLEESQVTEALTFCRERLSRRDHPSSTAG